MVVQEVVRSVERLQDLIDIEWHNVMEKLENNEHID